MLHIRCAVCRNWRRGVEESVVEVVVDGTRWWLHVRRWWRWNAGRDLDGFKVFLYIL